VETAGACAQALEKAAQAHSNQTNAVRSIIKRGKFSNSCRHLVVDDFKKLV
jgi:hypothetical protein